MLIIILIKKEVFKMEFKRTVQLILFIFIAAVFYYSWIPNPDFRNETYLPSWLVNWSNYYYNLRTAVPFFVVGVFLESYSNQNDTIYSIKNKIVIFLKNFVIAALIVSIAECGQFLIKNRNPDLKDVFFGIIGSFFGGIAYHLIDTLMCFKKIRNAE